MDSYFVDFTAHIDERKRPENFPSKIHNKRVLVAENREHLQMLVNDRFHQLILAAGMVVLKNDNEIIDENKLEFDKSMYVPWHMITHLTLDVKHMPAKPMYDMILPNQPPEFKKDTVN